ncbi:MAG: L-2-hydroxyglutarate oxidase [Ignavibacteria bacterium]|nr:L-2-hydroxyglutarate oxidase [Ignavibacteria bacterium]MBT8391719.1 L-2-hydroxyglutarate oxidase [Ignavibacteria bacterium]NNJ53830.1 L-2-hydroxyglutarate oxidase [Ignavibacteriaceae bacterium]NNL20094.1 L-2-hydroxyglutarate oxidase [Ignavibacteriaceae bacterium]
MNCNSYDIVVIGGGIIGTSTALTLQKNSSQKTLLIESEKELATHQTGNNSGVIHSGLYYKPGSLKAKNCTEGRKLLYDFCQENNIKYENCGKIVVATEKDQLSALENLFERGTANGLTGIKKLSAVELKEYEPNVSGVAGLFVPQTGIVDFKQVTNAYSKLLTEAGGEIKTICKFLSLKKIKDKLILNTTCGEIKCKVLVNCGGLYSDRIARICNVKPGLQIIPFRGEYYKLKRDKENLVKNLIYPVPNPKFPFLGVHFTKMINGGVEAGPNAVLAFKKEGYTKKDFSFNDVFRMLTFSGFWKMAAKYYKMGFEEFYRSFSKKAFVKALQKLVPEIEENDIQPGGAGVRAQALGPNGKLVDDFRILETEKMVHVLNAPSPAATASISIGRRISKIVINKLEAKL